MLQPRATVLAAMHLNGASVGMWWAPALTQGSCIRETAVALGSSSATGVGRGMEVRECSSWDSGVGRWHYMGRKVWEGVKCGRRARVGRVGYGVGQYVNSDLANENYFFLQRMLVWGIVGQSHWGDTGWCGVKYSFNALTCSLSR